TNPPYGARMGERDDSLAIYEQLGARLRGFVGWRAAVLTGASEHARALGHRPEARRELANGPLQCELLTFTIVEEPAVALPEDLVGRLRKNLKTLGRWARRAGVTCYRIYDADIPSYAIAVDVHETDAGRCLHIHEYAAPSSIDPDKARARLDAAVAAAAAVLEVPWPRVFVKQRRRQRKGEQYERIAEEGSRFVVREGPCRLLVNFTDHLDTGLYLDHRDTRALIGELAAGRDFLNLFAYTATASVHAALGGARSTTSVDRSNTYCDWALDNLALNGLDADRHRVIRADVDAFLRTERRRYGLVFVDTPTFSNARHTPDTFDVQRDHVALLRAVARLLTRDGVIVFSTHARRFELDSEALADLPLVVTDITRETIPRDFARAPRIHRCYRFDPRP
ncbi:MAG: bifunctional 23S rRNA (guanine(2069)-N(7))-methyltransferase RlmK/23S rRNA (guanine(2445)-N(2))-methyltransferase RlmL, partial [Myxococcales bacterium]|nr:bifunctional 23S rRNA (guanine(2069)-N(7))-methyltransferase RlmK/23S rRNA (guanine(2445)-N(2))-methyltransferase RlmL [Myxococcales bacterium]